MNIEGGAGGFIFYILEVLYLFPGGFKQGRRNRWFHILYLGGFQFFPGGFKTLRALKEEPVVSYSISWRFSIFFLEVL